MRNILLTAYLIPLISQWILIFHSRIKYGRSQRSGDTDLIDGILKVVSFVPVINWFPFILMMAELYRNKHEIKSRKTDYLITLILLILTIAAVIHAFNPSFFF